MIHQDPLPPIPPFPSNVSTAPISTISLAKLLESDPFESARVLSSCQTHGFFYLDLTSTTSGTKLLSQSNELFSLAQTIFSSPLGHKTTYALQKGVSLFGYKSAGTVKQTDKDLRPDSTEFYNVAKDHMLDVTPSKTYPDEIVRNKDLFRDFMTNAHETGMLILAVLAKQLGLLPEELTVQRNDITKPSGDHVRLTHQVPASQIEKSAVGLPSHTDFGSITILFNWLGGLQIQSHDPDRKKQWEYVKPLPNHAIVNLGDAMVVFTRGLLKSAKHRVVPAPGEQSEVDRYSVVYFVRPCNDTPMKPVNELCTENEDGEEQEEYLRVAGKFEPEKVKEGQVLTAGEWMRQRAIQLGS